METLAAAPPRSSCADGYWHAASGGVIKENPNAPIPAHDDRLALNGSDLSEPADGGGGDVRERDGLEDEVRYFRDHVEPWRREPLVSVRWDDPVGLLDLHAFKGKPRWALREFMARYAGSRWLRRQWGHLERVSLAAAVGQWSRGADDDLTDRIVGEVIQDYDLTASIWAKLNPLNLVRCGQPLKDVDGFFWCRQPRWCKPCNLNLRIKALNKLLVPYFDQAPFWYGGTLVWESDPAKAKFRRVTSKHPDGKPKSYQTLLLSDLGHDWPQIVSRFDLVDRLVGVEDLLDAAWQIVNRLADRPNSFFDGLLAVSEIHLAFHPACDACWHSALPHINFIGTRSRPVDLAELKRSRDCILVTALSSFQSFGTGLLAYPDLELSPLESASELRKWLNYAVKAAPFHQWYASGIRQGISLPLLNGQFAQAIFAVENMPAWQRSLRSFGNLNPNSKEFIGPFATRRRWDNAFKRIMADEAASEDLRRDDLTLETGVAGEHGRQGQHGPESDDDY